MSSRLKKWATRKLGSLLAWLWKRYGQKALDTAVANHVEVTINDKKIPLASLAPLAAAFPIITDGLKKGHEPEHIVSNLKRELGHTAVNVIAAVLSILFPGIGTGIGALMKVIMFMMEHTVPMTQEEENAWFNRFGAGSQS